MFEEEEIVYRKEMEEIIDDACLKKLTSKEEYILKSVLGYNETKKTLRALGDEVGLSAERVRQISYKAMKKIKKEVNHGRRSIKIRRNA